MKIWLTAIVALATFGGACGRAGVQEAERTESVAGADGPSPIVSSHDEPFVIDNGPAKFYFGRSSSPQQDGNAKKWKRHAGVLKALAVHRFNEHGDLVDIVGAADLVATKTKRLEIVLQDKKNNPTYTDTIKVTSDEQNTNMLIESGQELLRAGKSRLRYAQGYEVYLTKVTGYDANSAVSLDIPIDFDAEASTRVFVGFDKK